MIGSAAYMFRWMKEATNLARRNRALLASKPVWLFSSGPVGPDPVDAKGRDQKVAAVPKDVEALAREIHARDHHVFFGAYFRDRKSVGLAERFMTLLPANTEGLPQGDFRYWPEIEAWANGIAGELIGPPVA